MSIERLILENQIVIMRMLLFGKEKGNGRAEEILKKQIEFTEARLRSLPE